jgi:glycosyltransferase involved in cell wall biosynthesis
LSDGRIAILVPCYNAGALLAETIQSAAGSGLPGGSYAWLVSDNASEDGSVAALPARDANNAPIIVTRNATNLGRVENWNCALETAERLGFSYAFFLMAGDLLNGDGLLHLRARMEHADAVLGLGSYDVVDSKLRRVRTARRIAWPCAAEAGLAPAPFIAQSLGTGAMLLGPLGANLYRLNTPIRLRFDPSDPSHADQRATCLFACAADRPIVYVDCVVSRWRARPDRFHSGMNHWRRLQGDWQTIQICCQQAGVSPDRGRIAATFLVRTLFHAPTNGADTLKYVIAILRQFTPLSWSWPIRLAWRRLRHGTPWLIYERNVTAANNHS